jgi:2-polyprenyl-3-methyl-5-hydroxy-6-metoxy-1,4-benzoquinol methylase
MDVSAFHRSAHIDEDGLLEADDACPLCGSRDRRPLFDVQADPTVTLLACDGCGGSSVSRMPTAATRDGYYAGYYDDNEVGVTADDPTRLARRIAEYAFGPGAPEPSEAATVRILDFGGGNGAVSHAVADLAPQAIRHVDVTVVDYNPDQLLASSGRIAMQAVADLPRPAAVERFDVVIAGAVLEHLPDPMATLNTLIALLAPRGLLYIRTPYVAPLIARIRKVGIEIDFTFPAHLHDLGQPFWESLASRLPAAATLTVIGSRPSPVETGRRQPARTVAAAAMKAPWRVLGRRWPYVGGWEIAWRASARPEPR